MQLKESYVKGLVKKLLEKYGAHQHWPVQTGYGAATLDCVGCYNSLYFAVETKRPGKTTTARQDLTIKEMREAGAAVFVVGERWENDVFSGMDDLEEWLLEHRKR